MDLDADSAIEMMASLFMGFVDGYFLGVESNNDTRVMLTAVDRNLQRIADALDPPPPDIVDSTYVAQRLGCTTTWIADQARNGEIPAHCLVPGTGRGKPWRFLRRHIDEWINSR